MSERYGHEKAMAEPGVAYTGPLEYVVDREFKDGHPPRRFTATEAAAELNRLHAEVERLLADAARLDALERWGAEGTDSGEEFWGLYDAGWGSIRDTIDKVAADSGEATWLQKGEPK